MSSIPATPSVPIANAVHSKPESPLVALFSAYCQSKLAVLGLMLLVVVVLAATLGPLLSPQDPYDQAQLNIIDSKLPPGSVGMDGETVYLLGTDAQGRDMLSGILYGLSISILVGFSSTLLALTLGTALGLIAAYVGGRWESFIMRTVDIQLSFPAILIALILIAILGQGVGKVVAALVLVQWAYYARTARSAALVERKKEYIEAAVLLGLPTWRILAKHLLPNCMPPLMVMAALQVASAIKLEATLSFLGVGLPITEPSLGLLISNGFQHLITGKSWMTVYPGLALVVTIVAINLVADRLRDVLNPKLQSR